MSWSSAKLLDMTTTTNRAHRTLLGDGIATSWAACGGLNTTYGECWRAITGIHNVSVVRTAAILAVVLSFVQKIGALISTIPTPVMGGVSIVLFGIIAASGLRTLVESGIDYGDKRNLVISSVILVLGIGGAELSIGPFTLQGMGLAALIGILLNLFLPYVDKEKQTGK